MGDLCDIKYIEREDGVIFHVDDLVKHFKGNIYKIIGFARDCENLDVLVVYKDVNKNLIWTRKVEDFLSKKGEVWRFEKL